MAHLSINSLIHYKQFNKVYALQLCYINRLQYKKATPGWKYHLMFNNNYLFVLYLRLKRSDISYRLRLFENQSNKQQTL